VHQQKTSTQLCGVRNRYKLEMRATQRQSHKRCDLHITFIHNWFEYEQIPTEHTSYLFTTLRLIEHQQSSHYLHRVLVIDQEVIRLTVLRSELCTIGSRIGKSNIVGVQRIAHQEMAPEKNTCNEIILRDLRKRTTYKLLNEEDSTRTSFNKQHDL